MRVGILALGVVLLGCGLALGVPRTQPEPAKPKAKVAVAAAKPVVEAPKVVLYTVRNGENDWTISKKHGITVHELHLANPGIDWLKLQIGQQLTLPGRGASPASTAASSQAPAKATTPAKKTGTWIVKKGENDWLIASRLGVKPSELRALNPGVEWTKLKIGAKLTIPKGKVQTASASGTIRGRYAVVAASGATVRRGAKTSAPRITTVEKGTRVTVLDRLDQWYKLKFPRGTVGWVRGDLLKEASAPRVASSSKKSSGSSASATKNRNRSLVVANASSKDIVERALGYRGVRYSYGSASRSATDCSGLTTQVYKAAGVALPRTSREQSKVGQAVSKSSLKKGDLVFFKTNRGTRINHVGIYVGDGKFVHASSAGGKVKVDSINDGYYNRRYAGARRVATTAPAPKKEEPKKEVKAEDPPKQAEPPKETVLPKHVDPPPADGGS